MTRPAPAFHSRMSRTQRVVALLYLPVHVFLLPRLLLAVWDSTLSDAELNLLVYAVGFAVLLGVELSFLRRDFDPLCEHFGRVLLEVCICYGLMLAMNLAANAVLTLLSTLLSDGELDTFSPNNEAIMDLLDQDRGSMTALALFLAPMMEEIMFRGGVFGTLRPFSRPLAYGVTILLFSLYHTWGYALNDPLAWLYLLQYLPASYVLCRCYERTDSIWGSILLHALVNYISLQAMQMLEKLL